ncbi:MAG: bifunctional hydroxymethylpyrimidine kinase/phosphomethylpyrimidine kinase, partial [Actinomycetota bacterium]|nr:bifunctional hydroxymethylpyrimidine kinase/phosphomethylpyrimidine kinase [Actinomycetota bacterium]
MGVKAVLVKGFPLEKAEEKVACDLYYDGADFVTYTSPWVADERVHGTGCVLSAALAANLALGRELKTSVELARNFVLSSKRKAISPGSGVPCANPFAALEIETEV